MRKALIGILAGAAALTPLASAQAQDRGNWRDGGRAERQQERAGRQDQRGERQVQRAERQVQRAERQVQRADRLQPNFRGADRSRQVADRPQPDAGARNWQGREERVVRTSPRVQVAEQQRWQGDRSGQRDRNRYDRSGQWDGRRDGQWNSQSGQYRSRSGQWDRNRNYSGHSRNWNRGWRNDNRYNWQHYRNSHRSIFSSGRYYAPYRGYRYQRFSIGLFLEPLFYSSNYWISDPYQYRLPPAYPGTMWVRYYDDVLLVDTYSGEVIDVIYDFFW